MENKTLFALRLERISVFLSGLFLLFFPLFLTTVNTDSFVIPKETLLGIVALIGIFLLGLKGFFNQVVKIKRTPFDLPLVLFALAALLSSIFAVNKADAFTSFVPLLFAVILYFVITNSARRVQDVTFLNASLVVGAIITSVVSTLSYFKIYLPFAFAKVQTFSTIGSLFDQSIYLILVLVFCLYMSWPALKKRAIDKGRIIYAVGSIVLLVGTLFTIIGLLSLQKPQILPYQTGFQISFAEISQDQGRVVPGFLFGSGIGTFITDFTRFKPASFNANADLWNLSFLRSSNFVFELLATTGLLGILSFVFLAYKVIKTKPLFLPLVAVLVLAFLVPFSLTTIVLMFVLLALFSASQGLIEREKTRYFDVELKLVALRRGVFALGEPGRTDKDSNLLPYAFLALIAAATILLGFISVKFVVSDYLFQQSLIAASQNNAQKTYQLQTQAIQMFPQRDAFQRVFAQVNMNLANNLSAGVPKGSSPSAQVQNTIYQLIQASINSGRNATTVSPQTALNWQNLSSIYRNIIGFGQNADTFAIISNQQALVLDPNNPQEYINYGGILYQLKQWDNAIRQFQLAVSLKPDYANAHYNLGHALEQKGDLQGALTELQTVKTLVANDPQSLKQINAEIKALQDQIGSSATNGQTKTSQTATNQPPLEVNQPNTNLPTQNPPVKIPGPKTSPTPTPSPKPSETPTPTPGQTP